METQFIRQLLDIEFYTENKSKLSPTLFDDDTLELYNVLVKAHDKYGADLNTDELFALWQAEHPVAPNANVKSMKDLTDRIGNEDRMNSAVAADLLAGLWQRNLGKKISQLGINMMEGKDEAFDKLTKLIDKHKDGFLPTDFGEAVTKDINKLLAITSDEARFRFNIPALSRQVYGIGRQEFGIIFARPETGKTALGISLCFAPGGFADQGRKVAYLGNEERAERSMLRAYQAYTGMTKEEITNAPHLAQERFEIIEDKVTMQNIQGWPMTEVEGYIKYLEADAVVIDQGDKVNVPGNFTRGDERLRDVYTQGREMFKSTDSAGFFMSQASAEADGKTIVLPGMMEGSKTGKFAEADLIIGVGKYPDNADGTPENTRFLTIGKNKLSGYHGTITCKIEPEISRYVD